VEEGRETESAEKGERRETVYTHPRSGNMVPECSEVYTCSSNTSIPDLSLYTPHSQLGMLQTEIASRHYITHHMVYHILTGN